MKKILLLLTILLSLLLTSCVTSGSMQSTSSKVSYPDWVYRPSGDGYVGGVGISRTHFNGVYAQRQLATSRAIDDIARQIGVKVDSIMAISSSTSSNGSSSSDIGTFSVHSVTGQQFKAKIIEVWEHPETDEIYIYMKTTD